MPGFDLNLLNCAVYLYPSKEDAEDGKNAGGSGFLVSIPARVEPWVHLYVVTNKHVVEDGRSTVLRLNTRDGQFTTQVTQIDQWERSGDDDLVSWIRDFYQNSAHDPCTCNVRVPKRRSLSRISFAVLVQRNGFGLSLWAAT